MQMAQNIFTVITENHTHTQRKLEKDIEKCPEDCFVNLGFCNLKKKKLNKNYSLEIVQNSSGGSHL